LPKDDPIAQVLWTNENLPRQQKHHTTGREWKWIKQQSRTTLGCKIVHRNRQD